MNIGPNAYYIFNKSENYSEDLRNRLHTVKPPLTADHRDQEKCHLNGGVRPFNRGDDYKHYMSVLPAEIRRSVPLIEVSQEEVPL